MRKLGKILRITTCLTGIVYAAEPHYAIANPVGGVVSAGQASIDAAGATLNVRQSSDKAVIDWRGFDIAPGEHTQFHQPSASSLTLNRVNDIKPSQIDGKLTANGNVVVVNPNGIVFGRGAQVDVNGLVATTADIDNHAFMEGDLHFNKPGKQDAAIVNAGEITARQAGLVGLVAPNVINSGTITAKLGKAQLAAGETFTLDMAGDGLLAVAVPNGRTQELNVINAGHINADGGSVKLTAASARDIVDSLIVNTGVIEARSIGGKQGTITLFAEGSNATAGNVAADKGRKQGESTVLNSGRLDASGRRAGERGGSVLVTGDNVGLLDGTVIDTSGHSGKSGTTAGKLKSARREESAGGEILIGGDYLGQGSTPTARNLYVSSGALIVNDALDSGDAGRSIFWSDNTTRFYGNVYARALGGKAVDVDTWSATSGGNSGDGGFVETSGHGHLDAGGYVDLTASNGSRGTYFLDPTDITIYGNVDPAFVSTDSSINLASNLKLWLDASDTTRVNLTYSTNGLSGAALTKTGANTLETTANLNLTSALVVGARIRLGAAGSVTAASTLGNDTFTIASISYAGGKTTITTVESITGSYTAQTLYRGLVSQITDKSGQGHNATQGTASSMPLWVSNGQNGLGVVQFDGVSDYLDTYTPSNVYSLIVNYKMLTGSNSDNHGIFSTYNTGNYNGNYYSPFNPNGDYYYVYDDNYYVDGSALTKSLNTSYIFSLISSGTTISGFSSGIAEFSESGATTHADTLVFGRSRFDEDFSNSQLPEAMAYNSALSTNSRNLLEQYQSAKWGIALTPPGSGATEAAKAMASTARGDGVDGYSVFTTRYLERLSQTADISLQASNNINLDLKTDTLALASGRNFSLTAGNDIKSASAGSVVTSGSGAITLTAGNDINFAHDFDLNSASGVVTLTSANAITYSGNGDITSTSGTVNLQANILSLTSGTAIQTTGDITIKPYTSSYGMSVGSNVASTLNISNTALGFLNWGNTLYLGGTSVANATAGTMTINTGTGYTFPGKVAFYNASGYDTTLSGALKTSYAGTGNAIGIYSGRDFKYNAAITGDSAAGSGASNIWLSAYRDIISNGSGSLSVTNTGTVSSVKNTAALTMNSDADANQSGGIYLGGGNFTTNGGNVTLGGGADPATESAYGTSGSPRGIDINGGGIYSSTGNILMHGIGYNNPAGTDLNGIWVRGATVKSTTGTITMAGRGGNGNQGGSWDSNVGVNISNSGLVSSGYGNISLTGVGGDGANYFNAGVALILGGKVESTGVGASAANIAISGIGGTSNGISIGFDMEAGGILTTVDGDIMATGTNGNAAQAAIYNSGILLYDGNTISATGDGNITLNAISGAGQNGANIVLAVNANTINASTGNITLNANTAGFYDAWSIGTGGVLTFAPYSQGSTIGVGGATGTLGITSAILNNITASTVRIGRNDGTGLMRVAGIDLSGRNYNLELLNGSANIQLDGSVGSSPSTLTLATNKSFSAATASGSVTSSGDAGIATSGTGGITIDDPLSLGGNLTLASAGTLTFGGTVNSATSTRRNLTASAGTFSFGGAWGGTQALGAVSLTSANGLTLPAITASSLFARTTGAGSDISLGGNISASNTSGTSITLASADDVFNPSSYTLSSGAGSRWLVYSENPADNTPGGITGSFNRYGCSYAGGCATGVSVPASGNGFVYSYTPMLTATPTALSAIIYGAAAPSLSGYGYTLSGYLAGEYADTVTGSLTGSTGYAAGSNVGSYAIGHASGALASALGYGFTYASNASAITVNPRAITVTPDSGQSKVYGAANPAYSYTLTSGSLYNTDTLSGALARAAGETVAGGPYAINQGTLSASSNYAITFTAGRTFAITPYGLSVAAAAKSKIYGAADPALTYSYGTLQNGDTASVFTGALARTAGETVAGGPYAISQNTLSAGSNYTISYTGADLTVTPYNLIITATAQNKVYDGTTGATVTLADNRLFGDVFTTSYNAAFTDRNAGNGKNVAVSSIALSGAAAGNYSFNTTASTIADITPKGLTVSTDSKNKLSTDTNPIFTGSVTGLVSYDIAQGVSFAYAPQGYNGNPGVYTIAAIANDPTGRLVNYNRTNNYGDFTVTGSAIDPEIVFYTPSPVFVPNTVSQVMANPAILYRQPWPDMPAEGEAPVLSDDAGLWDAYMSSAFFSGSKTLNSKPLLTIAPSLLKQFELGENSQQ